MRATFSFWFFAAVLSVFFAEVVSGSSPMAFFLPNTFLLFLIYGLHIIVLGNIVLRFSPRRLFSALFVAGIIFGFYEAYITKVIWNPMWGMPIFSVGGIALIETLMLVLWLHPIFSFIIPLALTERIMLGTGKIGGELARAMPELFSSQARLIISAFVFGVFHSAVNLRSPELVARDFGVSAVIVVLLMYIVRLFIKNPEKNFSHIIFKKTLPLFAFLLGITYLVLLFVLRFAALPGLLSQAIVWMCYIFLAILLSRLLAQEQDESIETAPFGIAHNLLPITASFLAGALLLSFFPFPRSLVFIVMWCIGILFGMRNLFRAMMYAFKKTP